MRSDKEADLIVRGVSLIADVELLTLEDNDETTGSTCKPSPEPEDDETTSSSSSTANYLRGQFIRCQQSIECHHFDQFQFQLDHFWY